MKSYQEPSIDFYIKILYNIYVRSGQENVKILKYFLYSLPKEKF